jgi:hypothetical protein
MIQLVRPDHPNLHLARGTGQRNERRRQQVRELVSQTDAETGLPLTFAAIADLLGISRERVRQLAWEEAGVRGKIRWKAEEGQEGRQGKGQGEEMGGREMVMLRGQRRYFKKEEGK